MKLKYYCLEYSSIFLKPFELHKLYSSNEDEAWAEIEETIQRSDTHCILISEENLEQLREVLKK